ncbi:MAG: tetratricopeptide repeat protein [Phycisphaerae bacterium]|nr:tetratricopeptide repeat protein [Phycisphaerae bacterium]
MRIARVRSDRLPRRVLLLGWDAADWQMIDPLVSQGLMPTLASLLARGARGNLATTQPMLSPILWNTIATGRRAEHHGILGFTEPSPDGSGIRPSASTSRRTKAIWNILTQSGLRSHVVGWYASHPAEPIAGTMVSNQLEFAPAQDRPGAPFASGVVHPASRAEEIAQCRVHASELGLDALVPFVPNAAALASRPANRLGVLSQMLAQTASVHAMATRLLEGDDWDFAAVYLDGIDRFGHQFMEFHPPRMAEVSEEDFAAYEHCMTGIYRFHDMMLETLLRIAGEDAAVLLISDHGYHHGERRPDPREGKAGPVDWHRPYGVFAGVGPGIRAGGRAFGASILDVVPTVLTLLGLPAARDMPGRVLAEVLDGAAEPPRIDSWEAVEGECGRHPEDLRIDPAESRAAIAQLVELGYIAPPSAESEANARDTAAANRFNLACSIADAGSPARAAAILDELDPSLREEPNARLLRASCAMAMGELDLARSILVALAARGHDPIRVGMMLAGVETSAGDAEAALARLEALAVAHPRTPGLHRRIGEVAVLLSRHELAEQALRQAIVVDPQDDAALGRLAEVRLLRGDPEEAVDLALRAASLEFRDPRVHLVLGRARLACGDAAGAVEALETCLRLAPRAAAARSLLGQARHAAGGEPPAVVPARIEGRARRGRRPDPRG